MQIHKKLGGSQSNFGKKMSNGPFHNQAIRDIIKKQKENQKYKMNVQSKTLADMVEVRTKQYEMQAPSYVVKKERKMPA